MSGTSVVPEKLGIFGGKCGEGGVCGLGAEVKIQVYKHICNRCEFMNMQYVVTV